MNGSSEVLQEIVLSFTLLNVFISDLEENLKSLLTELAEDTKTGDTDNTGQLSGAIWITSQVGINEWYMFLYDCILINPTYVQIYKPFL